MVKFFQGKFKVINTKKYIGNVDNVHYRSSYEFKYMRHLDHDPDVISWNSEELVIPYHSPVDKKRHRYYPDFVVKKKTPEGVKVFVIEIKPMHQTKVPKKSKNRKKMISESITYMTNQAKWKACDEYCQRNGMIFQILSEQELRIKT